MNILITQQEYLKYIRTLKRFSLILRESISLTNYDIITSSLVPNAIGKFTCSFKNTIAFSTLFSPGDSKKGNLKIR